MNQIKNKIGYFAELESREKYMKESTVEGIAKVANMERQIIDSFSDFLQRLSYLKYEVQNNGFANYSKEDLEEINKTKENMKEFAYKKLDKAKEMVDIIFSGIGTENKPKIEVIIKKDDATEDGDDKEEKDATEDGDDKEEKDDEFGFKVAESEDEGQSPDKVKKFIGKSVVIKRISTGNVIYGSITSVKDNGTIKLGQGYFIDCCDIKEIKELRK